MLWEAAPALDGTLLKAMLNAIAAFRMPVTNIEAQFKMNQNRTPADPVMAQLRETAHPDPLAMAGWMQAHERY